MEAQEFAIRLAEVAPSYADLLQLGLSLSSSEAELASYHLKLRPLPLEISFFTNDGLAELIKLYDVSALEIGMVSFMDIPINYGTFVHFASVETDLMVVGPDGQIKVLDGQQLDYTIWKCAVDGRHFLEAMVLCSHFFTLAMLHEEVYNNEKHTLNLARTIAQTAGGEEYLSFYEMLFGV